MFLEKDAVRTYSVFRQAGAVSCQGSRACVLTLARGQGPAITLRSDGGTTPVSPAQPSVNVRLYDAFVPGMKLEPKQRQMAAKPTSHTGLCPSGSGRTHLASETPGHQELCLPKALPWLMTGPDTGSHTQALIHGRSHSTPSGPHNPWGACCLFPVSLLPPGH